MPAAAVPAAAMPATAESAAAEPSAEPAAAALSAAAGGGGGVGMAAAAAAAALSLELGQQVNASDLVVHSSNGMTGWSANERSDGGMGALTIHERCMLHACARDEDACLHIGARAVRLARTATACIYTQQAPVLGSCMASHTHSLGYTVQVHGTCRRSHLEQVRRGTERPHRAAYQRRLPARDAAAPHVESGLLVTSQLATLASWG